MRRQACQQGEPKGMQLIPGKVEGGERRPGGLNVASAIFKPDE